MGGSGAALSESRLTNPVKLRLDLTWQAIHAATFSDNAPTRNRSREWSGLRAKRCPTLRTHSYDKVAGSGAAVAQRVEGRDIGAERQRRPDRRGTDHHSSAADWPR
jgi:hypothetical protein